MSGSVLLLLLVLYGLQSLFLFSGASVVFLSYWLRMLVLVIFKQELAIVLRSEVRL